MGGFFLLFLCVCVRLVDLQIVRQKELTARGVKQWTRSGVVSARRGDIVDTNGKLLAQSVTSFILTARPRDVKNVNALAGVLARELGLSEETIIKKLSGSKAASVTLARQISREDADRLRAIRQSAENPDSDALIGITFDEDVSRWYPMGTLLAQVLGLCNVDGEGQSGLELKYNDELSGKPGRIVTEVDARARTLPDGVTLYVPAEQGHTLRLTIDRDVQAAVERAVRECAQVNDAVSVQAIAMDVNTGAVLAMAMYPTYDPANPPRDDLDKLNELMRLTVLGDVYEPGSTFKMLTASAAIDCGATIATHTFNGMVGLHHRAPGVLGAVLTDDRVSCEIIADFVHLHPATVDLICRAKGMERVHLISDSMYATGLPDGDYPEEDRVRHIRNGACVLDDGRISGSTFPISYGMRNLLTLGVPLEKAVMAGSQNPAKAAGLFERTGSITPGKRADVVLLDSSLDVVATFVDGCPVYGREGTSLCG